jgi:hypothetical protein
MPVKVKVQDWVWIGIQGEESQPHPESFIVLYQDDGVVDKLMAFLDAEKIGVLSGRFAPFKGWFNGAFSREDAVKVMHWLEQQGLLPVPNYEGYKWIKVPRYKDDPSLSWEDRYKALEAHHVKETSFLIAKIRELAAPRSDSK